MATSIGRHVKNRTDAKSNEINNSRGVTASEMHEEYSDKSIKIQKSDFTCAEFRKQLDGGAVFDAVNRFLVCSQQYEEGAQPDIISEYLQSSPQCTEILSLLDADKRPPSEVSDIISEYLQSSPQCTEILSLLDADKRPPSENKQIFEVLTQILLRITDDLSHHASSAVHIVNLLLRAQIRHIYRALNSSNTAKIIMAALKLLVAMVAYSSATAKEVMALFKMDHEGLLLLLGRIDNKRPEDVRVYMVRFLMAFLITNDSNIIEQLLSYRELMKSIFKSFRQDRLSTLQLILPTMQQYIVCNSSISKTQKLKLFNDFTLPQIALLYDWQGVNDIEADDDGKAVVRELVHGFLKEVTCNLKYGINFHDKSMGTTGKSHNSTLLKFALTQKAVNRDSLVAELVMKILQTCPDILPAYLSKCSLSFTPRNSVVWQKNMAFVMKVYSSLQIISVVTNMKECQSVSKMVAMAMVATVPGFMTQAMINQGLKQGGIVALTCLDMVLAVLNQAQKIMNACNQQNIPNKEDFSANYHLAIQKVLPDVNTVLPVWQKVLLKFKEESSGKETKKDVDDNQNSKFGLESSGKETKKDADDNQNSKFGLESSGKETKKDADDNQNSKFGLESSGKETKKDADDNQNSKFGLESSGKETKKDADDNQNSKFGLESSGKETKKDADDNQNGKFGLESSGKETKKDANDNQNSKFGLESSGKETKKDADDNQNSKFGLESSGKEIKKDADDNPNSKFGLESSDKEIKKDADDNQNSKSGLESSGKETKKDADNNQNGKFGLESSGKETKKDAADNQNSKFGLESSGKETKKDADDNQNSKFGLESSGKEIKKDAHDNQNTTSPVSNLQLMSKLLEMFCAYQNVLPSSLEQTSHDFTLMVHSVFRHGKPRGPNHTKKPHEEGEEGVSMDEDRDSGPEKDLVQLQCHCLKFLMGFPSGRFRWFKEVKGEGTVMSRLLSEMSVLQRHTELYNYLVKLIHKILLETCLFEHAPSEVSIWLDSIMTLDPIQRSEVVTFLQSCLTKTIRNPHPYNDNVADFVAAGQSSRQQSIHGDRATTKVFSIEDIPDVHDISIDPTSTETVETTDSDSDWKVLWPDPTLPCSALLPVAFEKYVQETSNQSDAISCYISNVTTTILHQQVDPLPLCLLVQHYADMEGKPANDKWRKMVGYIRKWLEGKGNKLKKKPPSDRHIKKLQTDSEPTSTVSSLLQTCFEVGPQSLLHQDPWTCLKTRIATMSPDEVIPTAKHVLLYLHTVLDMPSQYQMHGKAQSDFIHQCMKLIMAITDHAIKLYSTPNQDENTRTILKSSDPKMEDSNDLMKSVKQMSGDLILEQLAETMLAHPMFMYWFQHQESSNTPSTVDNPHEVSAIVTGFAVKFLATFRKHLDVESLSKFVCQYAVMTFLDVKGVVDVYESLMSQEGDLEVDGKAEDSLVSDENDEGMEEEEGGGNDDDDSDNDDDEVEEDEGGSSDDSDSSINGDDTTSSNEDKTFDLSIFPYLATFVNPTTISDIVCQYLQQPDVILPDGKADFFTRVICALACSSHEAELRIGGLLAGLLQTTRCEEFGRALLRILSRKSPKEAFFITKEMLVGFLDNPTEIRVQVSASLIEQSLAHRCTFESWCHQTKDGKWSLHDNKVMLLYVVERYLEKKKSSTTDTTGVATLNLLWDVYWPWLSEGFAEDKLGTGDSSSGMRSHMKTVFCHLCATPKTTSNIVVGLLRRILKRCLTEDCLFHGITELQSLRHKLDHRDEIIFFALLLQQMTVLCKEENNNKPELMEEILNQVNHHLKKTENTLSISRCRDFPQTWKEFLRHVLKDEYDHQLFLTMLGSLVLKLYDTPEKQKQLFSLERLYQMIISHSKFLPSMLEESSGEVKGSLARLLLIIAELEPSVCQTSHFAVFLGAYSATLANHDRCILALMNVYEKHNAVMWEYRPYMWGPVAITQHASRKALGPNLWQQPTMREVLELLDPAKLHQSALTFPLENELMSTMEHDEDGIHYEEEMTECYDPSFLLPLFSHLLAPEAVVDCKKVAECHALEYTLSALGSHNASMRTAAYHILAAYNQHLVGARLMGKRELMYLVECLRNSITEQNCRLPNVVALFIGRVATVMTSPAQHIYPLLVQFLTIKPQVQMNAVPMFQRLFYSTNLKHGKERDWLLQLLLDGLRDAKDFQVYEKTGIFKTLLAFQLSVLCAESLNKQIKQLLEKACSIPEAAYQLIRQHNLLTWIDAHMNANSDMAVIESNITLLNILTKSLFTSTRGCNASIKEANVETLPDAGGDDALVENQFGRKLPSGSCQLIFSICMRLLDYLTKMALVKPVVVWQYLETLSLACQFQKNLATDPKLSSHVNQHWLPLATHHIAQLLFLLGRFLKSSKVLEELASACGESGMDDMAKAASDAARAVADSADGVTGISQTGQNAESTSDCEDGQNGDSHINKMADSHDESLLYGKCCHSALGIISCWRPFPGRTNRSLSNDAVPMDTDHISDTCSSLRTKRVDDGGISTRMQTASNSHGTAKPTADNEEFLLFTIKRVLSTVTQVTSVADSEWRDCLQFVTEIVDYSGSVQEKLIRADGELSKEVMKVLLGLYTRNLRATEEDSVNHVLLTLVAKMEAGQRSSEGGQECDLLKAVKTEYKEPIRICREMLQKQSDGSSKSVLPRQLTSLLMQELWSGSPAPQHFWDAWHHSGQTKPATDAKKTTSKRLAEDGDGSKSGKKKRKKATKKVQRR